MGIQNFAEEIAKSSPDLYPDGAISVLKQFEKLQSAQKEITNCQVMYATEFNTLIHSKFHWYN
jgi:hypothetical protein